MRGKRPVKQKTFAQMSLETAKSQACLKLNLLMDASPKIIREASPVCKRKSDYDWIRSHKQKASNKDIEVVLKNE